MYSNTKEVLLIVFCNNFWIFKFVLTEIKRYIDINSWKQKVIQSEKQPIFTRKEVIYGSTCALYLCLELDMNIVQMQPFKSICVQRIVDDLLYVESDKSCEQSVVLTYPSLSIK